MNTNIYGDFQICISVPLKEFDSKINYAVTKIWNTANTLQVNTVYKEVIKTLFSNTFTKNRLQGRVDKFVQNGILFNKLNRDKYSLHVNRDKS